MLSSLILPIVLCAVALFFASFLSWMVLQLHVRDWRKMPRQDEFMDAVRPLEIPAGNYMFPACDSPKQHGSAEHQQAWERGPRGFATFVDKVSMGRNLGLTFIYFLVTSFCLAYLATLALPAGASFLAVFRFVSTAGLMTYLSAIVGHAIWFNARIVGHIIESIGYAAIAGAIFGAMWPAK